MTIDLLKQNLITAAEIKDAAERVKAYRGVLTDAIDYIYESTNTHKPEKASLLELVDSDVLANPASRGRCGQGPVRPHPEGAAPRAPSAG